MPTIFGWQNLKRRWTTLHLSPTPISSTAVAWSQQHSFHSKYPAVPDSTSTSLPGCDHARCHQQLCTLDERCLGKHVEVVVPETRKPPTKPTVPVKYSRIISNQNLLWLEFFSNAQLPYVKSAFWKGTYWWIPFWLHHMEWHPWVCWILFPS